MNDAMDSLATARQRARQAKQRELAAHERAIRLHEQAAELQARLGHHDRAEQARQYAALERERIALALAEQARWEAEVQAFDSRAPATTPLKIPEPAPWQHPAVALPYPPTAALPMHRPNQVGPRRPCPPADNNGESGDALSCVISEASVEKDCPDTPSKLVTDGATLGPHLGHNRPDCSG